MKDKAPAVQAGLFLRNLFAPYGSGYLEIRAFNGGRREQSFHELPISGDRLKHLCTTLVQKSDEGFDVYVGVLPRKERFGKASSIREAATVWADFDNKNLNASEMDTAIEDADMVVHSGGGMHAYWYTTDVEDVSNKMRQENFSAVVQDVQLSKSNGKADSTHDLPRILRVPGTQNWKDRQNPKPVLLTHCNSRVVKVEKQDNPQPVDTPFHSLMEDEPMYSPIVHGSEEDLFFRRLAMEAAAQNRLYQTAKQGGLPELAFPIVTPGGRNVNDLNLYVVSQMERVTKSTELLSDHDLAYASRELDYIIEWLMENGHAY